MPDIYCAVCEEPWDAYGVRKDGSGDMEGWEAKLFLEGVGCPCCAGEGGTTPEKIQRAGGSLLISGYDDFGHQDAIADGTYAERATESGLHWDESSA